MSINPVQIVDPQNDGPKTVAVEVTKPVAPVPPNSGQADLGMGPKPDSARSSNASSLSEIAQDEVEVQRDSQSDDEIVIRYVDRSGHLILQIPSSQLLKLAQAVEQALAEEANRGTGSHDAGRG